MPSINSTKRDASAARVSRGSSLERHRLGQDSGDKRPSTSAASYGSGRAPKLLSQSFCMGSGCSAGRMNSGADTSVVGLNLSSETGLGDNDASILFGPLGADESFFSNAGDGLRREREEEKLTAKLV